MTANENAWAYAVDRDPPPLLRLALEALRRERAALVALAPCNGDPCGWVRGVAECLKKGDCRGALVFCEGASPACCVANKVPGVRAAAVDTVDDLEDALAGLGANVLIVDPAGKTYFEFKQMLRLCLNSPAACPAGVARVLEELDGHAHR